MAKCGSPSLYHVFFLLILTLNLYVGATEEDRQVYIVYMGSLPKGEYSPSSHHLSILQEVIGDSFFADSLIRSYKRSFNGFAAKLNHQQQEKLTRIEGVVSVFPSRALQLQTTRSWDFMGLTATVYQNPDIGSDIIIGVIDSGIWPESESFSDAGFGPVPKKWKGSCQGGVNFTCNKKIIGARYYSMGSKDHSARDTEGHGTHTASTAVGNKVKGVNFYGLAEGTATGGVPSARIAVYKVCHPDYGCQDADILAAFDDAIADGVDIITISMGRKEVAEIYLEPIAIGAFHAMEKGILTSNSAGNRGPEAGTVASVAPWLLTVAASSTDRRIIDRVVLGNGRALIGTSVNAFTSDGNKFPLIYGKDATSLCEDYNARMCDDKCLDSNSVKGKIVLCDFFDWGDEAYRAGALGLIGQDSQSDDSVVVALPASALSPHDYDVVKSYMNSTKEPQAEIFKSEAINFFDAPVVASFSSRGPNRIMPQIMKPDISAPGIDILAAYSPMASPSDNPQDKRSVKYSISSGTSMSCPHAAGAAAYIKALHTDWSPSAIKSALMTTAWSMNATNNQNGEFAYGSGHINPVKAANPGLVYEAFKRDYIKMLCNMGYDVKTLRLMSGENETCPERIGTKGSSAKDLNYPSMADHVQANKFFTTMFRRTVTNVGPSDSTYKAEIAPNSRLNIKVVPSALSFKLVNEKKSFVVTVDGVLPTESSMASSSLVWSDGTHSVRSPIIMYNTAALHSV